MSSYDRSYNELALLSEYNDRLNYLMLMDGNVVSPRAMAMTFYKGKKWLAARGPIIKRDVAFDLGVFGVYIPDKLLVHHINPITDEDILNDSYKCYDPNNLITVSLKTHNIIHYGTQEVEPYFERTPGDTTLWEVRNDSR